MSYDFLILKEFRGTLIWDFDGTLATRDFSWEKAFLTAISSVQPDHSVQAEDVQRVLRQGFPWHLPEDTLVDRIDTSMWWARIEAFFALAFQSLGFADHGPTLAKMVHQMATSYDDYILIPDAMPTLAKCAEQGWNQVILSNHMPDLPDMVHGLGLTQYVSQTFASASYGYSKPSRELFEKVLATLPTRENVWMIGDSYEADIVGGMSVGLPSILVRSLKGRHSLEASDLEEAMRIFSRLS